ncbi:MAG: phage terminase large subunit family protein [Desulfobulbaceae bacterium]|nr:phage terminase large subunit family protein [Desulfobulbaceae bacterium]
MINNIAARNSCLDPALLGKFPAAPLAIVLSRAERSVFRKRKAVAVSEWCARHRVVTMSSLPGPWRNEVAAYLAGIMDASFYPSVREVSLCKAPQTGGSEAVNNCIAYAADRAAGPVLYVYPDERTAKDNCKDRITPMFTHSPRLRSLMTGLDDDAGALKLKLSGMPIYMAWCRSVSSLANKPCRYVVFDETDKYQASNDSETDPIHLGSARVTTFPWTSRIWKISSPTTESGYIWQAMITAQVIFEYVSRCPSCNGRQVMRFGDDGAPGGVRWPHDCGGDPEKIEIKNLAWYECEHCQAKWSDQQRDKAVQGGHWQAKNDGRKMTTYLEEERPRKIAFHVPAWLSTFVSLSRVASAFLRCKQDGKLLDLNAHKNFYNTFLAEPSIHGQQIGNTPETAGLIDRMEAYAPTIPMDAGALTAGVDIQMDRIEIEVVAWGVGAQSWGMDYAVLHGDTRLPEVWDQLDTYLMQRWQHESGESLGITRAFVDSGYLPVQVYKFCSPRKGRGIYAIKGASAVRAPEVQGPNWQKLGNIRCQLFSLGTNRLKSMLFGYFGLSQPGPGYCHIPEEYPPQWFDHLTAEHVVTKEISGESFEVWEKIRDNARNEAIDLRAYALAALLSVRIDIKGTVARLKSLVGRKEEAQARLVPRKSNFSTRFKNG